MKLQIDIDAAFGLDFITDNGILLTRPQMEEIVKRVNLHEELIKLLTDCANDGFENLPKEKRERIADLT